MDVCFGKKYAGNAIADDQCCCPKSEYLVLSPIHMVGECLYVIQRDFLTWFAAVGTNIAHGS